MEASHSSDRREEERAPGAEKSARRFRPDRRGNLRSAYDTGPRNHDADTPAIDHDWEVVLDGLRFPEGPRWHDGALWFSDVHAGKVYRLDLDGGTSRVVAELGTAPSGLGFLPDGRLLISSGTDLRVYRRDHDGVLSVHADLSELASWQLNDMCVDGRGRAYVGDYGDGSAPPAPPRPTDLLRVDPDGSTHVAAAEMMFANGMVVSADGGTLVVAETRSAPGRLTAFSITDHGTLTGRRTLCEFEPHVLPDGLAIDAADNVWVASPFSDELFRVTPQGTVDRRIAVPTPYAVAVRSTGEGSGGGEELVVCSSPEWRPEATAAEPGGRILRTVLLPG